MKRIAPYLMGVGLCLALRVAVSGAEPNLENLIHNNGLPSGPVTAVLPRGAIFHVQFGSFYQTLLNVEKLAKSVIPDKAVPPEAQALLQSEHPLLTLLGMKTIQQELTADNISQFFGIDATKPISITLYPGDPRQLFVITVPLGNTQAFAKFLKNALNPKSIEEASLIGKSAVHLELEGGRCPVKDLYIACSAQRAYICGGRALALALYNTPAAERLDQDAFMNQAIQRVAKQDISLIFNPGLIKPFLLQAQQLHSFALPIIHSQRERLVQHLNPQIKMRVEMQLRNQFGFKNFDQFADYAECFVVATYQCLCDALGEQLMAFQGLSLAANLDPGFPQLTFYCYSHQFQPAHSAKPIPLAAVRKTMAGFGKGFDYFSVTGEQPPAKLCPFVTAWFKQFKNGMEAKGLKSAFVDRCVNLIQNQEINQPLGTQVPWLLTTRARLNAPPSPREFQTLEDYGQAFAQSLTLPLRQQVRVVPDKSPSFLEAYLQNQAKVLNHDQKMAVEFRKETFGQTSWLNRISRTHAADLDGGVRQVTFENGYVTRSGFFGYDQHEFINRKIYLAREVDGSLVFYHGGHNANWLANLHLDQNTELSPALAKLMDRVPEGTHYLRIHRVLNRLPRVIDWASSLEGLAHTELDNYLAKANEIFKDTSSVEDATKRVQELKMPPLVWALNRDADTGKLYCLLPGNIVYPRPMVGSLLKQLVADYAAKDNDIGGGLIYTRVRPDVFECSIVQSTEGIARLISTMGNILVENYIGSPEKQEKLRDHVVAPGDFNPNRFSEIVMRNPRWEFIPMPRPRRQAAAKPSQELPQREAQASANLIDLSKQYNASLTDNWHAANMQNNTLKDLPQGIQEFKGVKFDVRGIIQLSGGEIQAQSQVKFPKEVKGIAVGQKAEIVHFLHATGWTAPDGTKIGTYLVHFANGRTEEIPIIYGQHVRDWWTQQNEATNDSLEVAWSGKNPSIADNGPPIRLFKTSWKNPVPDAQIESIDYQTAMSPSAPFLIAITVQ